MNCTEYVELKNGYAINEESWAVLWRKLAFIEFDAELEEFVENWKEKDNNGDSLMDVSIEDVECIIDEYLDRWEVHVLPVVVDEMRNAIQAVTGLVC